ncbi:MULTISPECIES: FG-GAP repeat domain-containing protein [Marinovum]|uniref:FG-GAP repeat domain-containing protein n=1 Tax=Marinovum TaxID=367771 RepID=UPI00237BA02C|nr:MULTISPECIES: VCBS repeat-containing protein [Marinovum]MDD9740366.1 VCBS repeat-containing protein [Marinovum sp. SP66]
MQASYGAPTDRYPHGVLGDDLEWGSLQVTCGGSRHSVDLPEALVFEDVAPRLAQLDGQGPPEVIVVESHRDRGARLAIWGLDDGALQRRAATPFIGTRFRWLAPLGAADLDGDGRMEIAYVDRPHLARVLRVWRYEAGDGLREVAQLQGLSNHRIGAPDIAGGIRDCGQGPEMILADAQWRRLVAVTLNDGTLTRRDLGPHRGRDSFGAAMGCDRPR